MITSIRSLESLVLFCKSYRADLDRCAQLVESVRAHNRQGLPFFLSLPRDDRSAFVDRIGTDGIHYLADEDVVGGSIAQSWRSQQLVKLKFARMGLAEIVAWFDSDFVVIRDFGERDFLARPGLPFLFHAEFRRSIFQDHLFGAPDRAQAEMLSGMERLFRLIRDTFDRNGPLFFFGPPVVWSTEVVRALEDWLRERGLTFEMMLALASFELNWYGEFALARHPQAVVPAPDPAFHFTRDEEYRRFVAAGFTTEDLAARGYLAVNFASKWMAHVAISGRAPARRAPDPVPAVGAAGVKPGRIDLGEPWRGSYHRTGWGWALDALAPFHEPGGVRVEGFIDKKFGWGHDAGDRHNGFAPHLRPWIGFWHNPPGVAEWFNWEGQSPHDILASDGWRESAPHCRGIFTLSETLARWLRPRVEVPVCSIKHPSAPVARPFSMDAYRANPRRSIAQVGWWLRRFASLHALPVTALQKVFLDLRGSLPGIGPILEHDQVLLLPEQRRGAVTPLPYLTNDEYDLFLSRNLVFLHLYDASANNTLVECMIRKTPVLVNPLDAVVEYLGPDYPLYFRTLEEAAAKAEDDGAVAAAHAYLRASPVQSELTREAFVRAFLESTICRQLGIGA